MQGEKSHTYRRLVGKADIERRRRGGGRSPKAEEKEARIRRVNAGDRERGKTSFHGEKQIENRKEKKQ